MLRQGRRTALAGALVALAITAAACGSGSGSGGQQAAVSIKTLEAAVSNTEAAESTRFVMDLTIEVAGESMTMHGEGVASGDGQNGQISMRIPSVGTMEQRIVDGTFYANFGDLLGSGFDKELGGKKWVVFDLDELGALGESNISQLADQSDASGPKQGLEYLQGLSGDVEEVGEDTVAGRPATRYRASIDYAKVAAEQPGATPEMSAALTKLGTVPADVWIDDQDRVVKMHFAIDAAAFGGKDGKAVMTMEITDFDVPVDVQAPPADETVDLSALSSLGGLES
jgi:hypothetical protein